MRGVKVALGAERRGAAMTVAHGTKRMALASVLGASLFYPSSACGPSAEGRCLHEAWAGYCALASFTLIKDGALPVPHVVYEAIYRPQPNQYYPRYTPPEVRLEFTAASRNEAALREHLAKNALVACRYPTQASGLCAPGVPQIAVPPFNPDQTPAAAETGPQGCRKIEAVSGQGYATEQVGVSALREELLFAHGSTQLKPESTQVLAAVAERLKESPNFECVGITGQITGGEPLGLAEERSRAVRNMLVERGVEAHRFMFVSTTTPLVGDDGRLKPADPLEQRVSLTVVLDSSKGGN